MEEGEKFVGGFAGGFLARGTLPGYGIYATTERIVGVDVRRVGSRSFLGGTMAGFVQGQLFPRLSAEESGRVIRELDEKKEFDLRRDEISRIEIKNPGLLTRGHMLISPRVGEKFKVGLLHKIAFERLRDLMQVFYPEAVSLS